MKKFDLIVAVIIIAAAAALYFGGILAPKGEGAVAVIYVDGAEYKRLPLDTDTEVTVDTEYGENIIAIEDGFADCIDADCKDRLCVNQKKINRVNQTIVCLPHKLVVKIEGAEVSKIDSISK